MKTQLYWPHLSKKLQDHALWLISALSFVPDKSDAIAFVENYGMTEVIFDVAVDAYNGEHVEFVEQTQWLLLSWAMSAGKHQTGLEILERALCGLAALALASQSDEKIGALMAKLENSLSQSDAPSQDVRDSAARGIRRRAAAMYRRDYSTSRIEHVMSTLDHEKLRLLLGNLANALSPSTANEAVNVQSFW